MDIIIIGVITFSVGFLLGFAIALFFLNIKLMIEEMKTKERMRVFNDIYTLIHNLKRDTLKTGSGDETEDDE